VAALFPVTRKGSRRRPLDEGRESLVGRRIETIVEAIELERADDRADVGLCRDAPCLVGPVHHARNHDGGADAEERTHPHHLDERKPRASGLPPLASRFHRATSWLSWNIGSRIAST